MAAEAGETKRAVDDNPVAQKRTRRSRRASWWCSMATHQSGGVLGDEPIVKIIGQSAGGLVRVS